MRLFGLRREFEKNGSVAITSPEVLEAFTSNPESTFLVSFPRTGSHWLRLLMELYFERPSLVRVFYYPERTDYLTYHTHDLSLDVQHPRVIYLYREPVATIYSQMQYHGEDLADLIVVSRQLEDFPLPDMRHVAGDLVVKSGKPVLAVPDYAEGLAVAETALVAWDGSHTAAAALRAAVPLLQLAGKVVVLQFSEPDNDALVEDAAIYLSRHGVHAVIRRERPEGKIGDALIAEAASGRYAYVVMGGFGHLRFVEGLFGGVTRTMLTKSPIPVFLAH